VACVSVLFAEDDGIKPIVVDELLAVLSRHRKDNSYHYCSLQMLSKGA
jgi:hypothetical protein